MITFKDLSWPLKIGIVGGTIYILMLIIGFIYGYFFITV